MEGKSVLITGAGSGIGRAASLAFSAKGARVVAVDLRSDVVEETAQIVARSGGTAHALTCDVSSLSAVEAMFAQAVELCGSINFAFNNAGIGQNHASLADIGPDEYHRIMRVNVDGIWHCLRSELKHMAERGSGAIVNTASIAGLLGMGGPGAYVASKHAVVGLTKTAAVEYAASGIRVNAICPGGVNTPMLTTVLDTMSKAAGEELLREARKAHPMGRLGEPEEMADAAVFLCSDQARFITGVCLAIDGGRTAN